MAFPSRLLLQQHLAAAGLASSSSSELQVKDVNRLLGRATVCLVGNGNQMGAVDPSDPLHVAVGDGTPWLSGGTGSSGTRKIPVERSGGDKGHGVEVKAPHPDHRILLRENGDDSDVLGSIVVRQGVGGEEGEGSVVSHLCRRRDVHVVGPGASGGVLIEDHDLAEHCVIWGPDVGRRGEGGGSASRSLADSHHVTSAVGGGPDKDLLNALVSSSDSLVKLKCALLCSLAHRGGSCDDILNGMDGLLCIGQDLGGADHGEALPLGLLGSRGLKSSSGVVGDEEHVSIGGASEHQVLWRARACVRGISWNQNIF